MPSDPRDRLAVLEGGGLQPNGLVQMVRSGDSVIGETRLEGGAQLEFEATTLRRERTGVHAHLAIAMDGRIAASTVFNVQRDDERTRLANSAARRIGGEHTGDAIKVRLDQFCRDLWEEWVRSDTSEWSERTEIPEVQHLLYPYVMAEAGTIVFGYKGQGKSWLGILWTMMLQHGISSRWHIARPVNAMFVNLERSRASVDRRRAMVGRVIGVQGMRAFHARGRSLADIRDALRSEISQHSIDVVIVDSLSRAGTGKLTADDDTNRAMDILNGIGCAWVALAHTAKSDGEHVFGSVMQENAADVIVQMAGCRSATHSSAIGCRLRVTAANDLPKISPEVYALDFDPLGLSGIREPERGEFPDLVLSDGSPSDRIAAVLSEEGPSSIEELEIATGVGRTTIYEALKGSRFVRLGDAGGRGKKARYALAALGYGPDSLSGDS